MHWFLIILVAGGSFLLGFAVAFLPMQRKELFWKCKWIELEHDTARKMGHEPRDIDDMLWEWENTDPN